MKERLDAVSFWRGRSDHEKLTRGRISDKDRGYKIRIPIKHWRQSDLPDDVVDWACLATDKDGNHYQGEVYKAARSCGSKQVFIASQTAVVGQLP